MANKIMSTTDVHKSDIRQRLLEVFEAVRELPGSDFEPERFIHYLVANPKGNLNIHNSFKGKRYFVKFIQQVEVTFAVCFSNNDLETLHFRACRAFVTGSANIAACSQPPPGPPPLPNITGSDHQSQYQR
jgi:hypothetical protein